MVTIVMDGFNGRDTRDVYNTNNPNIKVGDRTDRGTVLEVLVHDMKYVNHKTGELSKEFDNTMLVKIPVVDFVEKPSDSEAVFYEKKE